jgi:hypothetical protein
MAAGLGKLFGGAASKGIGRRAVTAGSKKKVQFPWKTKSSGTKSSTAGTKSTPLNSGSKPPLPPRTQTPPPPPPPPMPPVNKASTEPWKNSKGQTFKSHQSNGITPESLKMGKNNLTAPPTPPKTFGEKAKGFATSTFGQVVGGTLVGGAALSMFSGSGSDSASTTGNTGSSGYSGYDYGSGSSYGIPGSLYA